MTDIPPGVALVTVAIVGVVAPLIVGLHVKTVARESAQELKEATLQAAEKIALELQVFRKNEEDKATIALLAAENAKLRADRDKDRPYKD